MRVRTVGKDPRAYDGGMRLQFVPAAIFLAACGGLSEPAVEPTPEPVPVKDAATVVDGGRPDGALTPDAGEGAGVCIEPEHVADDCRIVALTCPFGEGMHVKCVSSGMVAWPHGLDGQLLDETCVRIDSDEAGFTPEYCCVPSCIRRRADDCGRCSGAPAFDCPSGLDTPATCSKLTEDDTFSGNCCQ